MRLLSRAAALLMLLAAQAPAQDPDADAPALDRINFYRKAAGVKPVTADATLSKGCLAHAEYLAKNADQPAAMGLGMHKEDPELPGYTKEGAKAAAASVIYQTRDPVAAVNGFMATLFHRLPLLEPKLTRVGLGYAKGGKFGGFFLVDTLSSRDGKESKPVVYPADQQDGVPLKFGTELPSPLPAGEKLAGYPITVQFPADVAVKDVTAELKDAAGKEIEVWLSTPEKPAGDQKRYQRNAVGLIAKAPFEPGTTYSVSVKATVNGKAWSQNWSFTTGKK